MKKTVFSLSAVFAGAVLLFTGCDNFLNGSDLKKEIDEKSRYETSEAGTVLLKTDFGYVTMDSANKVKATDSFNIEYSEGNSGYQFVKWTAEPAGTIEFENQNESKTKVLVRNIAPEISIKPFGYVRPAVTSRVPSNEPSGVAKNSSIYITFSANLSEENDLSKISVTMNGEDLLSTDTEQRAFKKPVLDGNTITIVADKKQLLNINGTAKIKVSVPGDFYYAPAENIKITLGSEIVHEYTVNNSTLEKAEINFQTSVGELTPSGIRNFNIGETFDINYKNADGYQFNSWDINIPVDSDSELKVEQNAENPLVKYYSIADASGEVTKVLEVTEPSQADAAVLENSGIYKLTVKVLNDVTGVSIKPSGVLLPAVVGVTPEYVTAGVNCDTPVVISFNVPVSLESFRFSDDEIPAGAEKLLDSNNLCYGYSFGGETVIKNISFAESSTGKDVSECFGEPVLSADGKKVSITPLYNKSLIQANSTELKLIQVNVNTNGSLKDSDGVLCQEIFSHQYRVNSSRETQPPSVEKCYFAKNNEKLQEAKKGTADAELSELDWSEWTTETYALNHASKVHFYVKGYEANTQLNKVRVVETQYETIDKSFNPTKVSNPVPYERYATGEFKPASGEEGMWEGDFVYNFVSEEDGIVKLDFYLEDYNENSTFIKSYYINKDTVFTTNTSTLMAISENNLEGYGYYNEYEKNKRAKKLLDAGQGYNTTLRSDLTDSGKTVFWFVKLYDIWYKPVSSYNTTSYSYGYNLEYEVRWSTNKEELESDTCNSSGRIKFDDCIAVYTYDKNTDYKIESTSDLQCFYEIPELDETKDYYLKISAYDEADNAYSIYGMKLKAPKVVSAFYKDDKLDLVVERNSNLLPGYTQNFSVSYCTKSYNDYPVFKSAYVYGTSDRKTENTTFSVKIDSDNYYENKVEFYVRSFITYEISTFKESWGGYEQGYGGHYGKNEVLLNAVPATDSEMELPDVSYALVSCGTGAGNYSLNVSVSANEYDNLYIKYGRLSSEKFQYCAFPTGEKKLVALVDVDELLEGDFAFTVTGEKDGKLNTSNPVLVDASGVIYNKVPYFNANYFTVDYAGDYLILNAPESKAAINESDINCYYCVYTSSGENSDLYDSLDHMSANIAKKLTEQGTLTADRIKTFDKLPVYYYSDSDKTKIKIPIRTLENKDYVICLEATDVYGNSDCSAVVYFKKSAFNDSVSPKITDSNIALSTMYHINLSLKVFDNDSSSWSDVFKNATAFTSTSSRYSDEPVLNYTDITPDKGVKPSATMTGTAYNKFYKLYIHSNTGMSTSWYWNTLLYYPTADEYGALLSYTTESKSTTCNLYNQKVIPYYFYAADSSFTQKICTTKELKEGLGALFEYFADTNDSSVRDGDIILNVDTPVLVQTLVSDKNWNYSSDVEKNVLSWEQHVLDEDVKNAKVLKPSSSVAEKKLYSVDTSEIPSGKYYVIVAHFSDGTSAISSIKQK